MRRGGKRQSKAPSHSRIAATLVALFLGFGSAGSQAHTVQTSSLLFDNFRSICLETGGRAASVALIASSQGWVRLSEAEVRATVGDIPGSSAWRSPSGGPARTLLQAEGLVDGKTTVTCTLVALTASLATDVERNTSAYLGFSSAEFSSGPIVRQRAWMFARRGDQVVSATQLVRERPDFLENSTEPLYIVTFSTAEGQPFLSLMAQYP